MIRMRSSVLGSMIHRPTVDPRSGALLLATLAALVLTAVGCDSGTQEPEAPAPEATEIVPDAGATAEPTTETPAPVAREGEIDSSRFPTELPEGATAAIPDNFPTDMPVYPGAQAAQGKGVEIEGSPQSAVQLLTNDALPDVHRFYSAELASKGWTVDSDEQSDAAATLQATKGDCKASVLITPAEGGGSDIFIVTEC
jgi:hypothetical protein